MAAIVTTVAPAVSSTPAPRASKMNPAEARRAATLDIIPREHRHRFLRVLTSILLELIGRAPNPWDLQHMDLGDEFQRIWEEVFPGVVPPHSFLPSSPLYRLVSRLLCTMMCSTLIYTHSICKRYMNGGRRSEATPSRLYGSCGMTRTSQLFRNEHAWLTLPSE